MAHVELAGFHVGRAAAGDQLWLLSNAACQGCQKSWERLPVLTVDY